MSQYQQRQLLVGIAAGAAASLFAIWVRRGQATRATFADRIEAVTQQALSQLGVAAESRFITVNGLQLHTVIAGPRDAQLVVLLHGFPENWYAWRRQIKPLVEAGYRVVVPDQRGYNLSDKPIGIHHYRTPALATDIRELIHTFDRDRAIIVGHDWGGTVAWRLAMEYPDLVEKLVILNSPHPDAFRRELRENPAQQQKSWYMFLFQLPWLPETLIGQSPMTSVNVFFRRNAINQDAFSSYDLHAMATMLSQPGALTAMLNWYRAAFRRSDRQPGTPIIAPTLIICGEDDTALGKSLTYGLETWVPNLKIHYIPNCGHWVQNEAPDEVNAQLLEFLKQ
jgi:pimeloyl-ACP methyl ester carboxylesterase